jgi:hypothetical protein
MEEMNILMMNIRKLLLINLEKKISNDKKCTLTGEKKISEHL